jgi:hypothetical protein
VLLFGLLINFELRAFPAASTGPHLSVAIVKPPDFPSIAMKICSPFIKKTPPKSGDVLRATSLSAPNRIFLVVCGWVCPQKGSINKRVLSEEARTSGWPCSEVLVFWFLMDVSKKRL